MGCTNMAPDVCWIPGTRQHCQIRGVGDRLFMVPMMVALGCPAEHYNSTGGGVSLCTACEAAAQQRFPEPQPFLQNVNQSREGVNESLTRNDLPSLDCRSCLPDREKVLTCGLGPNWRYCDTRSHPGLREALQSGCADPTGPCTFWRSAIEAAGCTLPFECYAITSTDTGDPHGGDVGAGATAVQPLMGVVASCGAEVQVPTCAKESVDGYGADDRTAWVRTHRSYPENLAGGVLGYPNSRAMQGVY